MKDWELLHLVIQIVRKLLGPTLFAINESNHNGLCLCLCLDISIRICSKDIIFGLSRSQTNMVLLSTKNYCFGKACFFLKSDINEVSVLLILHFLKMVKLFKEICAIKTSSGFVMIGGRSGRNQQCLKELVSNNSILIVHYGITW